MQLEEEGCLSVPGFNATVPRPARASSGRSIATAHEQTIEGDRSARARASARDRPSRRPLFLDRLRGIKRDLIVGKSTR